TFFFVSLIQSLPSAIFLMLAYQMTNFYIAFSREYTSMNLRDIKISNYLLTRTFSILMIFWIYELFHLFLQDGLSTGYKKSVTDKGLNDDTYTSDCLALIRVSGSVPHFSKAVQVDPVIFLVILQFLSELVLCNYIKLVKCFAGLQK